ncbi:DNA polymerase III alpha [Mycobacterium phage Cborch11]|nr:DNA polymerase III alpha [Mycobacterium phage Cborch11]
MEFVSFHTHSTFSYGDGFGSVEAHVQRVSSLGMSALALSEHGNVSSHVQLERECKKAGIKPIFGIEAYFAPVSEAKRGQLKTHLTIFAMDEEGYHNLNKLVTKSYIDSYYKPTVSWENLVKHNAGLAVLSGCADSLLSCTLLGGKFLGPRRDHRDEKSRRPMAGRRLVQRFADVFGDRFFLETQRFPGLGRTCAVNEELAAISRDTGIPLIATADVHYPYPHQNVMQTALHAAHRGGTAATQDADWEYDILLTYPESDKEIIDDLVATGISETEARSAVRATAQLAQRCTVELPKAKPLRFPGVDLAEVHTESQRIAVTRKFMWDKLREGWKYRCKQRPELKARAKEYNDRLKYEMETIVSKDFMDYFLINSDLVSYTKDQGKGVGPARGSAAGSLVCYLLRITEIDPLYPVFDKMIFERFIDKTREDMPDIDLDFDPEARPVIVKRAISLYGPENVANVGNHQGYRGVSALNAMAKAHALPRSVFKPIKDRIQDRTETDDRRDDTILDVLESYGENPEVAKVIEQHYWWTKDRKQVPGPLQLATWLEGDRSGLGVHAAGFVISSEPIPETCAIYSRESGSGRNRKQVTVIPYDKRDAEYLNLLKNDFLGLLTVGVIRRAAEMVGMTMEDMYTLLPPEGDLRDNRESRPIIERFMNDDLVGIFQFEGGTTRSVLRDVKPTEFRHLADINALSRPGPKYGGQTDRYIAVKMGDEELEKIHPLFDQHVDWTYGQIVYQEQIMFILRDLAGFPIEKVLKVRKIIGKKLGEHQFAALWEDFKNGCAANGVGEDVALRVWAGITSAAGYAFNTSHSYSYSWIAWQSMWLKHHHPAAFFAASLEFNGDGKDDKPRRTALIKDTKEHGRDIAVLPLDPNASRTNWSVESGAIRPGFVQIPKIGEATAADIMAWRDDLNQQHDKAYRLLTWEDLIAVKGIGKATVEKMREFAEKADPFEVNRVQDQLGAFRKQMVNGEFENSPLPGVDEFYMSDELPDDDHIAWVGFVANKVFRDEIEQIRSKTGKKIEEIREEISDPELTKKVVMFAYDENGEVALRINRWRLPKLIPIVEAAIEDHHIVVAWGKVYEGKSRSLQVKAMWLLNPD